MFHRFASALFRDGVEELSGRGGPGDSKEEEEEEDWILVNYLAEACSGPRGDGLPEEDEEEDLVVIPSPAASPRIRYASCTSLDSTADTDPEGGAEEDTEEEEEDGFLRVDASSLEESWFVTPPPCFTGGAVHPVLLEPSPLENLLIEHPSMSVYGPPRLTLDLELGLLPEKLPPTPTASGGNEKGGHGVDGPRHRPEGAAGLRRSSIHTACYAAALSAHTGLLQQRAGSSAHTGLLQQRAGSSAQNAQPLSRKALRRLNLLRPPKASTAHLQQPSQRHLNF